MKIASGKVVERNVVLEGEPPAEGTLTSIVPREP